MRACSYVWVGVLLAVTAVQALKPLDVVAKEEGYTLFAQMLKKNGITEETKATLYGTLFAPTDRAVNKFLSDMAGMTFEELLARPQLLDLIIAYHFVPGATITSSKEADEIISKDAMKPTVAVTADVNYVLNFVRSPNTGLVTLKDAQNNLVSVVTTKPELIGNVAVWGISSVLMSGAYFDSADDALRWHPEWQAAYEIKSFASTAPGPMSTMFTSNSAMTYFLPSSKAFNGKAGALLDLPVADLARLVEYMTVPGVKAIPENFRGVSKVETLNKGHFLKTSLNEDAKARNPYTGEMYKAPSLTLTDEVGGSAKVNVYNIYAGKSILQGIDAVLAPAGLKLPAGLTAAKATTESKKKASGRKLLQSNAQSGYVANAWSAMNTQDAINEAASGDIPANYATRYGSNQAKMAAANCLNCLKWNVKY